MTNFSNDITFLNVRMHVYKQRIKNIKYLYKIIRWATKKVIGEAQEWVQLGHDDVFMRDGPGQILMPEPDNFDTMIIEINFYT